jgi:N-acyl-L-homoserine lactone synthetase
MVIVTNIMAENTRRIPNLEATPIVETDVFHSELTKQFAIVAFGRGIRENDDVFDGYLKLRGNVYVHQTGFLGPEALRADGREMDEDDERASHFAILENRLGHAAVVGSIRLIEKSQENPAPLPIESIFPEAFEDQRPGLKSIEVSRFISCLDHKPDQMRAILELFQSGVARIKQEDLGPTFGIVEKKLERSLGFMGAPPRRIADVQYVEEYNTYNVGVEINTDKMVETFGPETIENLDVSTGSVRYWGEMAEESTNPTGLQRIA